VIQTLKINVNLSNPSSAAKREGRIETRGKVAIAITVLFCSTAGGYLKRELKSFTPNSSTWKHSMSPAGFAKSTLKAYPRVSQILRAAKHRAYFAVYGRDPGLQNYLHLFAPFSAGDPKARSALTLLAASQTIPFLAKVANTHCKRHASEMTSFEFCEKFGGRERGAFQLEKLFNEMGSDKSTFHDYHLVYGSLFSDRRAVKNTLEIGLGTNNPDVVSNMGSQGKPGASLFAFREFLPNARIFGADIDRRILFQSNRIQTVFVDQTDISSFSELEKLDFPFDLIIDDGLHSPNANMAVLLYGLGRLSSQGWLVVEDISEASKPLWSVVGSMLPEEYASIIISAKNGLMFAIQKS
jgi:hypothetical protein